MSERLYNLLPAIHRIRDAEQGEPLRALLGIIEEELELVEKDIANLADDWFIETSAEWVIPYIGDLLGVKIGHSVASSGVYSQRAFVANTLRYRRRKGTLRVVEDLARDVTGWGAHAVAFFENLGWNQHLNHLRFETAANPYPRSPQKLGPAAVDRVGNVNLRSLDALDRIDGPFDSCSHTVDVRAPAQHEGWHDIHNIGIFLWRLGSYPMRGSRPRQSQDYAQGFHFSSLGNPAPLFTNPTSKSQDAVFADESNVPGPIREVAFFERPGAYYGDDEDMSVAIYIGDDLADAQLIPIADIVCKDLSTWSPPPAGKVAIDVGLGRFAFHPSDPRAAQDLLVIYHYGFSTDMGGGLYDRRATLESADSDDWQAIVSKVAPSPMPLVWYQTIADAIAGWDSSTHLRAVVTIVDNETYVEEDLSVALSGRVHLIVQADDRNRPTVRLRDAGGATSVLTVAGNAGEDAVLTLSGLLLEGGIEIADQSLGKLELLHCTLVPGRALDENGEPTAPESPSIDVAAPSDELELVIESCIVGSLRVPTTATGATVRDSIVDRPDLAASGGVDGLRPAIAGSADGVEPGPPTTLERVTVFGETRVKIMTLASEVIFSSAVFVEQRQRGCIRYSYVDTSLVSRADGRPSSTPRRFRCQPDLALEARRDELELDALPDVERALIRSRVRPDFTRERYGQPGYAQLGLNTAQEVARGAEDGSEMGAFERLKQPQREANLRARLDEYLPYGLVAGLIYVT